MGLSGDSAPSVRPISDAPSFRWIHNGEASPRLLTDPQSVSSMTAPSLVGAASVEDSVPSRHGFVGSSIGVVVASLFAGIHDSRRFESAFSPLSPWQD